MRHGVVGRRLAYGPNINAPMFPDSYPKAWEALRKALSLKEKASAVERAYIDALAKRYTKEPVSDRSPLDKAFADAMRDVAKNFPDDLDVQTLYAEALMDTSPWNYWQPDKTPKPAAKEAIKTIESVLARVPSHLGADHLYIHLVEAGPNPEKAVPSADRIGKLAPKAGHLVHMASHIYVRVGRYHDAVEVNERASSDDEAYFRIAKPAAGMYPGGYYPHNLSFLWYANDLEGRSKESLAAAKKVAQYARELRCGAIEGYRQRYMPLLALARFGRWDELLSAPVPAAEYPFDRTMAHYARGIAFAAKSQAQEADQEFSQFKELRASDAVHKVDSPYFPGTKVLGIAEEVLAGKIEAARGNTSATLDHLRKAVEAEDVISYMEPPYWYYAVRLSLGAALLKADKAAEAEKVFRVVLKEIPANGWPLFGLEQSLQSQGKTEEAQSAAKDFKKAWKHADVKLDLAWF